MKLAILSILLCLASVSQSVHVHPNGTSLIFSQGDKTFTTDRRQCLSRQYKIIRDINSLQSQLEYAHQIVRDCPPRILLLQKQWDEIQTQMKLMDLLNVTNAPSAPVVMPPMPPSLPVNASVKSGLPANHQPEFTPRRDVMTAKE